jgi:hypothetical protein
MRLHTFALAAALTVAAGLAVPHGEAGGQDEKGRVADLIKQLGDVHFAKREAATRALAEIGEPALAALRKAADASDDAEVRARADHLVAAIEAKLGYLFNGKNLTGWYVESGDANQWRVEGRAIVARSGGYQTRNYLLTVRDYVDFILSFEYLLEPGSGGGVVFRASHGEKIVDPHLCDHPTLKLTDPATFKDYCSGTTHFARDDKQHCRPTKDLQLPAGRWHAAELTVLGDTCVAVLAGAKVVDIRLDPGYRGNLVPGLQRAHGKLGFQAHTGTVRFRNVRVERLKA